MYIAFIIIVICLLIDQITKFFARRNLKDNKTIKINNSLKLYYIENSGGANGIFSGNYFVLIFSTVLSLFVCLLLYKYYDLENNLIFSISLSVLVGGILGNFIDRIVFSYVTDFISVRIKKKSLPVFNFADVFIFIGTIFTLVSYLIF